jgi:hypothetical protein
VSICGERFDIDCVSTMDHSWGPRSERGNPTMSWLHAHFDDGFAVHGIFGFDQLTNGAELWLAHGYVLDSGAVYGLQSGSASVVRQQERYPENVRLSVTDRSGRTLQLSSDALTTYPWQCWPNMVSFNSLAAWECNGRVGFGEIQDFFEVPQVTELNSRATTTRASRPLSPVDV